jgi:glutamine amidotransferase
MCELLGISTSPAARMGLELRVFHGRAATNREGWGMAWWDEDGLAVVKEAVRADESAVAAELADDPPCSGTFLVHVRAATVGRVAHENCHPFVGDAAGRRWAFAHNGTIKGYDQLPRGGREPLGDTDSEHAFLHLLHRLDGLGGDADDAAVEDEVLATARDLSDRGRCNLLLSDGRLLFAWYDGHKTLHRLERGDAGHRGVERCTVLASVPITEEAWEPLRPGSFLVLEGGRSRLREVEVAPKGP